MGVLAAVEVGTTACWLTASVDRAAEALFEWEPWPANAPIANSSATADTTAHGHNLRREVGGRSGGGGGVGACAGPQLAPSHQRVFPCPSGYQPGGGTADISITPMIATALPAA